MCMPLYYFYEANSLWHTLYVYHNALSIPAKTNFLPGALRLIRHLHSHGIPMSVATSSTEEGFTAKTERHGDVFGLMSHAVTGSDEGLKRGKPEPGN